MWKRAAILLAALSVAISLGLLAQACNKADDASADAGASASSDPDTTDEKGGKKRRGKKSADLEDEEDQSVPVEVIGLNRGRVLYSPQFPSILRLAPTHCAG